MFSHFDADPAGAAYSSTCGHGNEGSRQEGISLLQLHSGVHVMRHPACGQFMASNVARSLASGPLLVELQGRSSIQEPLG